MAKITITELQLTGEITLDHELPSMHEGETEKLNVKQLTEISKSESLRFPKPTAEINSDGSYDDDDVDVIEVRKRIPRLGQRELLMARPRYQETVFLADGQPDANPDSPNNDGSTPDQVAEWRSVLSEIGQYHPDVSTLYHAGDLLDRGHASSAEIAANTNDWYTFENLANDFYSLLDFNEIYAIPGNHDREYRVFAERPVLDPFDYAKQWMQRQFYYIVKGNTVTIFMGDMGSGTPGYITDYVFEWWLNVCNRHRNMNVITVTHQLLPNTFNGTNGAAEDERLIQLGQRFVDAMTNYPLETRVQNVVLWVSGHTNTDTADSADQQMVVAHNTTFVNCGLHIPSWGEGATSDLTYVIMCATDGEQDVIFKRWNHITKEFIDTVQFTVEFKYPVILSSRPEHDGRYQSSPLDLHDGKQTTYLHVEHNPTGVPENYSLEPHWLSDGILDDRYNGNMVVGIQAGHMVQLPGQGEVNPDNLTHGYGFAAAWTAELRDGTEDDYTSDFVGWASGPGGTDASRIEAFRGHGVDGTFSAPNGVRSHYKSTWITGLEAGNNIQIVHNLDSEDLEIVYLKIKTTVDGRVFEAQRQIADSRGLQMEFIDNDTIEIAAANTDIFYRDNTNSGTAAETFNGVDAGGGDDQRIELKICLRKIPDAIT